MCRRQSRYYSTWYGSACIRSFAQMCPQTGLCLVRGYIATKRNLLHFCLSELVKINRFLPHLFTDIQFTVFEKVFDVAKLTGEFPLLRCFPSFL